MQKENFDDWKRRTKRSKYENKLPVFTIYLLVIVLNKPQKSNSRHW